MTLHCRTYWTSMAQLWLDLAAHLDETHASSERSSVFSPLCLDRKARDANL